MNRRILCLLVACCWIISCCGALASGVEYDEDGGVWDWNTGKYTTPTGEVIDINNTDDTTPYASEGKTTQNADGSITKESSYITNADGSITVESGSIVLDDGSSTQGSGSLTQEEWEARMMQAQNRNGTNTDTWYLGPEKDPIPVSVVYMGLARSMIQIGGEKTLVNTCDLIWATTAPENQVLAVVNANREGYASLRAKTSTKAFIMDHCITNRVVRVLSTGPNWTMVDYDGMRGYVQTSSLTFYPNSLQGYETGLISINGRTVGKSTINIRAGNKNSSRILGDYVLGTPLTIFSRDEKWCEVDVEGWHCYILTEYVTLEENNYRAAR